MTGLALPALLVALPTLLLALAVAVRPDDIYAPRRPG